ncbi:MAG: Gmad2 immunoglobulin-like domain-containing protein [Patescibacteria group bacterium]
MNNSTALKTVVGLILTVIVGVIIYLVVAKNNDSLPPVIDNPTEDVLIRVTSPQPYASVTSPLTITGEARGTWYFEATFPVRILDADGKELGASYAQAQDEWMTEEFVPFVSTLTFTTPSTETGLLVLEKDNPSGLPEHADEIRIPVTFVKNERTVKLYYYDANKDRDSSGNILCSEQGLVAVERKIPVTKTPIQDTLRLLLEGELTAQEQAQGIDTEYPLAGLELKGANLKNSHLTLEFNDPQNKTGGGACRVGVLWHQIEATAKQFPEVQSVSFIPEELFQP